MENKIIIIFGFIAVGFALISLFILIIHWAFFNMPERWEADDKCKAMGYDGVEVVSIDESSWESKDYYLCCKLMQENGTKKVICDDVLE